MSTARVRKALIPAAGRGTRFLPLTKAVPKELAPIVTTPAVEFVVAEAAGQGITDVLLVLSADKQAVADYFGPAPDLEQALAAKGDRAGLESIRRPGGLATMHQIEQPSPRGLGDAVAQGEQFAAGEPLAVLLPDDLIDDREALLGPMIDAQAKYGGVVVALIDVPRAEINKYGAVSLAPGSEHADEVVEIVDLVEKPDPADAPSTLAVIGRYVLPPEIFDALRLTTPGTGGEIQLTDAMHRLAAGGVPVHGVVFRGKRYDTGGPLGYLQAVVELATRNASTGTDFTAWLREYVSTLT